MSAGLPEIASPTRLLKSTTPVLQCSHAPSTVVTRPWWAATPRPYHDRGRATRVVILHVKWGLQGQMGHTVSRRYAAGCYACRGATRRGARGWSDSRSRKGGPPRRGESVFSDNIGLHRERPAARRPIARVVVLGAVVARPRAVEERAQPAARVEHRLGPLAPLERRARAVAPRDGARVRPNWWSAPRDRGGGSPA